jgi:cytochrome P450
MTPQTALAFDSPEVLANPYPLYRQLREDEPVHWEPTEQAWLITRYHDVVAALREQTMSAEADMSFIETLPDSVRERAQPLGDHFKSWIVFSDDPLHARLRSVNQAYLTRSAVARLREPLQHAAAHLLTKAERTGKVEVLEDFATPLALIALAEMIGITHRE